MRPKFGGENGRKSMSAIEAIKKLGDDYAEAHQRGDGGALAGMFWDDAVIIPPGKSAVIGRAAIDDFFSGTTGGADLTNETAQIEVAGDLAYDYGTASWTEDGQRRLLHYVDVYRLKDGVWKMQLTSWNTNAGITE
jgi:uncharacterized protein (TIGR02246 family)